MKVGEHIMLRPAQKAQQRTKNRIRENGQSGFVVLVAHMEPLCLALVGAVGCHARKLK